MLQEPSGYLWTLQRSEWLFANHISSEGALILRSANVVRRNYLHQSGVLAQSEIRLLPMEVYQLVESSFLDEAVRPHGYGQDLKSGIPFWQYSPRSRWRSPSDVFGFCHTFPFVANVFFISAGFYMSSLLSIPAVIIWIETFFQQEFFPRCAAAKCTLF